MYIETESESFLNINISEMNEVEVIRFLLSHVMPGKEAKELAKRLFSIFGSFSGVLEAPYDKLDMIEGMDRNIISYIMMFPSVFQYYMDDKNKRLKRVYDSRSAYEVVKPSLIYRKTEAVVLLLLDSRGQVMYNQIVNEGSVSEVPIYIRSIVELCLKFNAYTAVLAHNHPGGSPVPSKNDISATRDVEFALNGIDVELFDHIIIAGNDYLSMKSSEWLSKIKDEVKIYKDSLKLESQEQEDALEYSRNKK